MLARWERTTQNALDVNPNFWGMPPPIKRVIMRNISEQANLQSAIETGEADIVQDLGPEQAKALEGNPDLADQFNVSSTLLVYIGMNAKIAPLDNPDVREAVRYAINYDDIVTTLLNGNGKVVQEIIPHGLSWLHRRNAVQAGYRQGQRAAGRSRRGRRHRGSADGPSSNRQAAL